MDYTVTLDVSRIAHAHIIKRHFFYIEKTEVIFSIHSQNFAVVHKTSSNQIQSIS